MIGFFKNSKFLMPIATAGGLRSVGDMVGQKSALRFKLFRVSALQSSVEDYKTAADKLTAYLLRVWRVHKTANRDSTYATFRELESWTDENDDDVENELGKCLVITAVVSPEHQPGEVRNWACNVVLCLGRAAPGGRLEFDLGLARGGRMALMESVLTHLSAEYDCVFTPTPVAPHSLAFLAREWSRYDELLLAAAADEDAPPTTSHYQRLNLVFAMPNVEGLDTVSVTVDTAEMQALHKLVLEQGEQHDVLANDPTPSLIRALTEYLFVHLKIQLAGATMTSICTPVAELTQDGYVKFFFEPAVKKALVQIATATRPQADLVRRDLE
jgi:hypothetical protein